jgi:integrase
MRHDGSLNKDSGRVQFIKRFGKPIEEYDSFQRATQSLATLTMCSCRRMLPYYFIFLDQDPDSVIVQRKKDLFADDVGDNERYERLTAAYLKTLLEKGLAGKTVTNHLARVQGFFKNNARKLRLNMPRLKIPKARKRRKYSPSNEDVRLLFGKADCARDRLIVSLMYQNGPTPIDVSLLCVGDYPAEAWVYFERSRSKTGEVWRGVSMPDVCACLRDYLNVRGKVEAGERLFVGREGVLDSNGISQVVRELIGKTGLNNISGFKPTSLRDAFEDALVDAEIYSKTKEALMGHTSDIEHEYGGHSKMVSRLVEAMKKAYPLLCLNDANKVDSALVGLTKEDIEVFKEIKQDLPRLRELRDLLKSKELVHVDDPEK